ncbi:non-ribosomal peptide synthetase [Brevundimonas sp. ZS04]|uniref:non-ribosomal peptide synthetase n=1 Tax=Brevundimonas sp. ZS04 TaxID=1906854 RepID=UPI00096CA005|nr:non-ribosomal peptide synthetase [Brevundimonas sp. ZS04]OMG59632.1 non-ribosomal peptide synthetase [Brevundimonas sp. ZS04]
MDDGRMAAALEYPLTEAQSGLWFAQRLDPANPIFNTAHYLDIRGDLDVEAFRAAVDKTAAEAEALSLRFVERDGEVFQTLDPTHRPLLQIVDVSVAADPVAEAMAAMRRDHETPLDPTRDPLAANILFLMGPQRFLWSLRVHHLATDGFGMALLTNRVAELYNAARGGPAPGPVFNPIVKVWDEDAVYRASDKRTADAVYWREIMGDAPEVASLAPGKATTAHRFHRIERALPSEVTARLRARADAGHLPWPDVLTAIGAAYVRRFSGAEEAVIGVPWMGRMGSASARTPAMIMNVPPLRLTLDEDAPLDEQLILASKALIKTRRHGRYRSEQLRRDLGLIGGARRLYGPLVNVLPFDLPPRFAGLDTTLKVLGTGPVDDISFTFRGDAAPTLTLEVDANPDLYTLEEAAAHAERLAAFLTNALDAETLGEVPIATPSEAVCELEAFNATAHPVPDTTLTALLVTAMKATPDAPALTFGDQTLTYAELDRRTAALASALAARGVGHESLVAVALPRSLELVIALVAILRAGGAYLPLDLEHPAERIAAIVRAAGPSVVLAHEDISGAFAEALLAPADWPLAGAAPAVAQAGEDAAYVIYTSGSTGDPKGVLVEHRAIVNRLLWMQAEYGIGAHTRILQKTPATFDVSVWEFFLALISGGELVVAPPGAHRDPAAIAGLIRRHAITDLHFVPSMLSAFLADPAAKGIAVAHVFCSGEELPAELRDRFHQTVSAELHNLYGPTEAAVDVSYWAAGPDDTSRPMPIGWPVWNTRLVILDERLRPVAPGMGGHLHLGGVQLARGYLNRPDLTEDRFIPDPHHPGQRLYRTGDVARRRADGAVVYLGRSDHQVKIRGLRIELGEIEAAVIASGLARETVVLAREDRPGERRLVAYLVPAEGYDPAALKAKLAARLPDYMVPAAIMALDALPTTANGKLDRKALPAPVFEAAAGRAAETPNEKIIAELFAEALGRAEPAGADDDFFTLGGDSLLAVHLMMLIRERLGRDPGLGALFDRPRVEELAALIDAEALDFDNGLGVLIRLAEGDPALPPLFLIHPAGGLSWGYRTLARALSPRRTVWGVQSPALDPQNALPDGIDALASVYVDHILALGAPRPVHIAGWSVGGIIAQAAAVELERRGVKVGLMAMLDSYPAECWRAEPDPDPVDAMRALLAIAGYDPTQYPDLRSRAAILAFLKAGDSALGGLPEAALDGVIRVVLDTNRLVREHHHKPFGGRTTHVRAALDHKERDLTPGLWRPYAADLDVVEVPFLHPQLTGPAATALIAPALDARMTAAEDTTR